MTQTTPVSSETVAALQEKLNDSLRDIYLLAQKADEQLDTLKESEKGQFSAIFQTDSGFKAQSNRFLPYLIELSDETQALQQSKTDALAVNVQTLLQKIQKIHLILHRFHAITQ